MDKIEDINAEVNTDICSQSNIEQSDVVARSDIQLSVKSFTYTWSIGDFSKCLKFCDPKFYSPVFTFENTAWRLRLHLSENNGPKKMSIRLIREKGITDLYIKSKVSLLDDVGKCISTNEMETNFQCGTSTTGQISLTLYDPKSSDLVNDKLIVHCKFLVLGSNAHDDASLKKKGHSNVESEQGVDITPVKLPTKSIPSCTQPVRCSKERKFCDMKDRLIIFFFLFVVMQYLVFTFEFAVGYDKVHNKSCSANYVMKGEEINELIIDSTLKLNFIAEVLNLTEVKKKSTKILTSYLKIFNQSDSKYPLTLKNKLNESDFLGSSIKMFGDMMLKSGLNNTSQEASEQDRNL